MGKEKIPDLVNTFLNYLWVNIPSEWDIQYRYEKYFLFVNVFVQDPLGKNPFTIRRRYSSDIIKKFEDTNEQLAQEAAKEIIDSMKKKIE